MFLYILLWASAKEKVLGTYQWLLISFPCQHYKESLVVSSLWEYGGVPGWKIYKSMRTLRTIALRDLLL